jgi:superfamily I DNA/RNA helicase
MQWSPLQQAIFREVSDGSGHLVVKARAGSGKTTTILGALKHVPYGKSSLFCAFNKSISEALKARVRDDGVIGVEVSTLHSYGLRACTKALGKLKIESRRTDGMIVARVGDDHNFDLRRDMAKAVSWAKGSLLSTRDDIDNLIDELSLDCVDDRDSFVTDVLYILDRCKDTSDGILDFDDMIWLPVVLGLKVWQYDFVFVDETQDLNPAQIELVLKAVKPTGRVVAVGDPEQAIYGFRGAAAGAFERVRDALGARELPLSVTYRCGRSIVELAKEIVGDLEAAPGAAEGSVSDGEDATVDVLMRDAAAGDFVLSRTNAPLLSLCFQFLKQGRRAHIQGRDIGANLASFVKRSNAKTIEEFREYVDAWLDGEVKRLQAKRKSTQAVEDRAECLMVLSDGARTVRDMLDTIERLFADNNDGDRIVLSTTHKAKGLERERVWLLADTYRNRPEKEEDNLWYVAVTRAKNDLRLVYGLGKKKKRFNDDE